MAEAADEAEPVKLPGALLEAADEQHLAIIFQHLGLVGLVPLRLGRTRAVGRGRRCGRSVLLCAGALRRCCLGHSSAPSSSSWDAMAALWPQTLRGATWGHHCPPIRSEEHTSELQSLTRISYA